VVVGKFTPSDVLVVSGAAGVVGSVVGQIAKHVIKCKKVCLSIYYIFYLIVFISFKFVISLFFIIFNFLNFFYYVT
jgi:hypothetical protein